jgi:predicted SAM-dependent methyltransferase
MSDMPFADSSFDRIFCTSVIEHLGRDEMIKVAQEFRRILKTGGLLIATIDYLDTGLLWRDFIDATGLRLYGESDFTLPTKDKNNYDVVGFALKKE